MLNERRAWFIAKGARAAAYRALQIAQISRTSVARNAVYWRTGTPGGTVPARKSIGPTTAWDFAVADLLYAECPVYTNIDTTKDITFGIKWAPWAAEALKTVEFQLDIGLESPGTLVNSIAVTKTTTVNVPATQYEYAESDVTLTPAEWVTSPIPTIIHVRLTRVATGADPVTDPGVFHLLWDQTLKT